MCHEWWQRRRFEERDASRRLWDEFEQTRPISEPEVPEPESKITLGETEPTKLGAER
jgi:hypothetical protein